MELVEGCLAQSNTAGVPDDSDDHNVNDKEDYIDNDNDVSNDDEAEHTGTLKSPTDLSVSESIPSPSALFGEPLKKIQMETHYYESY